MSNHVVDDLKADVEELQAELEQFRTISPEVLAFAVRMQYKLDKNSHKPCKTMNANGNKRGWKHCSPFWLRRRIKEETVELFYALQQHNPDPTDVLNECADVANFAMMIFDNTCTSHKAPPLPEAKT